MKIALVYDAVYPYVVGGAEHRYYAMARLWRRSHSVSIVGLEYWARDPGERIDGCRYVGVAPAVPLYDERGRRRMSEAVYFGARLFPWLSRSEDDVWDISSFPYVSVIIARLVSIARRRPMVVTWLEYWGDYWNEYLGRWAFVGRALERVAAWSSPYVIAISERTKARLISGGYPADRIVAIPIGVDLDTIDQVSAQGPQYDLVCAGRLIAHKQLHLVIEAVALLRAGGRKVRLAIVGDGPEAARLRQRAADLGVTDLVDFLGRVPTERDVFAVMKSARVLVAPSRREGFGMTVVQGWTCGLPAVVCDEPLNALADLVDEPFKGRVVGSDAAAIATASAALLDEDCAERRAALRRAAERFRWETLSAEILDVYRRVVGGASTISPADEHGRRTTR
jgi:glycosyltransferase involved in cell wall biosynthesis